MYVRLSWKFGVVWDIVEVDASVVTRYHVGLVTLPRYPTVIHTYSQTVIQSDTHTHIQ